MTNQMNRNIDMDIVNIEIAAIGKYIKSITDRPISLEHFIDSDGNVDLVFKSGSHQLSAAFIARCCEGGKVFYYGLRTKCLREKIFSVIDAAGGLSLLDKFYEGDK